MLILPSLPDNGMKLSELQYVVALEDEGYFGRAAERCHVSQPALSAAVTRLEKALGCALFVRNPGRARPTPQGEFILREARAILAGVERIRVLANGHEGQPPPALRIACPSPIARPIMHRWLPSLQSEFPGLQWWIEDIPCDGIPQAIKDGVVDIGLLCMSDGEGPEGVPVFEDPLVALVNRQHAWAMARHPRISPAQLLSQPLLILGEDACLRHQIVGVLSGMVPEQGDRLHLLDSPNLENLSHRLLLAQGVAVVPASLASLLLEDRKLSMARCVPPIPGRTIGLVYQPGCDTRSHLIQQLKSSLWNLGLPGFKPFEAGAQPVTTS